MFNFNIDTDPYCVPYLSDSYIDDFCNDLIRRFEPGVIIEQLVQKFLGYRLIYENLTCDGSILGATMFCNMDCFPVYDAKRRRAKYVSAREGTIYIERALTDAQNNNLYRFTLAHEAGHALWHSIYYRTVNKLRKSNQSYLSSGTLRPREKSIRILEHQADRTAAALLMPKDAVLKLISPMGACLSRSDALDRIIYTSSVFRVSDAAAKRRLTDLGLIDPALCKPVKRARTA